MPRDLRAALAPLSSTGRVEAAADRLRQAITLGLVGPGDQLPAEGDLAAQLGVSSMTLRATLAILRREGLLATRRGRAGGTFVVGVAGTPPAGTVTLDDLRDLGDEWAALAGAAAALAARRTSAAEVERLAVLAADLVSAGDVIGRRRADWRFHIQLAAASQSVRLTRAERAIQGELAELLWRPGDGGGAAAREHRAIVAAIGAGDAARARRRAAEHVRAEIARLGGRTVQDAAAQRGDVLATLQAALEDVFARLGATREALLARRRTAGAERLRRADLQGLRPLLLDQLDDLVCGTGVIVAPDVVDVPRWLEWYWRAEPSAPPRRLTVELDPARPDFYDYERAEWFSVPRATGARSVTATYVDVGGTEQHIVTLSEPVLGDGGEFLGVAAADVRVSAFEPLLLGRLRAVGPRGAAVIDAEGRVVLSTAPGLLVGERWDGGGEVVRRRGVPWRVVVR